MPNTGEPLNFTGNLILRGMGFILLAALAALAIWLVLTWWFGPEKKTFKEVVQDVFRDAREIFEPALSRVWCLLRRWWAFLGPRLTNLPTMAVVGLDLYATLTPEMRELIAADHRLAGVLLALNLVARLSPRSAPQVIPPSPSPTGGMVNNAAIA